MKYIDADRLRAEIERRFWDYGTPLHDDEVTTKVNEVLSLIDSLQQEQLVKSELKEEKIECSPVIKEFIGKFLEVGRAYNFGFGPKDFLQEQPDVDLDEEIDRMWNPRFNLGWDDNSLLSINHKSFEAIARHFYELGLNARKEENK